MFRLAPFKYKVKDNELVIAMVYRKQAKTATPTKKIILLNTYIDSDTDYDPDEYSTSITIPDNMIIKSQFPNRILRDICYIAGPQGCGKSTYASNYITEFHKLYKNKYIYLISRIDYDKSFEQFIADGIMEQIDIDDDSIIGNPIDCKRLLTNSLTVFDDHFSLDKEIQKSINTTLQDCLLNGRDQSGEGEDIYCIVTGHQIHDYRKTRDILNECSSLTVFPHAGNVSAIRYVLNHYCGLGKQLIESLINLPSRWVTVYKRSPMYILHEKGVMLARDHL